ncbi:MAG: restriction endonuclease subunit S [Legionellaceae bacterium]|nr:restriction endonuclease subunit S [Legionellaceae bacterium]
MSNTATLSNHWLQVSLGDFMGFKNGINADKSAYGAGTKFVNVMDIFKNNFLKKEDIVGAVKASEKQKEEYSVIYGDILFNRTSEIESEIAYSSVYMSNEPITFGGFVIRGRQKKKLLLPEFSAYFFQVNYIRKEMIRRSQGVVRSNIGQKDLNKIQVLIPTKSEQIKISKILLTFDNAIKKTEALIAAKEKQFEWLVSITITTSLHRMVHLSSFIDEVSIRNGHHNINHVLSVTNTKGFVLPHDKFERRVASDNLSNYKVVKKGEFAYNPSRINVGSIARLDDWDSGVLSPMYTVFQLDNSQIESDYFLHWLSSFEAKQRIKNSAQGSVRETVSFRDFAAIRIPLPNLEIQKNIARNLNYAQQEISLLKKLLDKYSQQKQGLMQKLLTGEWTVNSGVTHD